MMNQGRCADDVREVHGEEVGGRGGGGGELGQDGEDEVVGEEVQVVRPSREPLPAAVAGAIAGDGWLPKRRRRRPLPLLPHGDLASVVGIQRPAPGPHLSPSSKSRRRRRRRRRRTGRGGGKGMRAERPGESGRDDREGSARCVLLVGIKGKQAEWLLYRAGSVSAVRRGGPALSGNGAFFERRFSFL